MKDETFECHPGKLLGALAGMPPHVGYVYVTVLLRIYESGGPCMDPVEAIGRRTGYDKRKTADALNQLCRSGKLFRPEGGGLMNPQAQAYLDAHAASVKRPGPQSPNRRGENPQSIQQTDQPTAGQAADSTYIQSQLFDSGDSTGRDSEQVALPVARAKRVKTRTKFPTDFTLDATGYAVAERAGIRGQQARALFERFKDFHTAKGNLMADWPAAWRTWVSNEIKWNNRPGRGPAGGFMANVNGPRDDGPHTLNGGSYVDVEVERTEH